MTLCSHLQPGQEIGCPEFDEDINDEDVNDDHKYTMDCPGGDGVFVMNKNTGCVTVNMNR